MKRTNKTRTVAALASLAFAPVAAADSGVSTTGWVSILVVLAIGAVLFGVHKKLD